jgi:hypothetical protein
MSTGKTHGAYGRWLAMGAKEPLLIIGPSSKMEHTNDWQKITGYKAYYCSYHHLTLDKMFKIIGQPGHIIMDECHEIKNYKSKSFKKLEPYLRKAQTTWLSATPQAIGPIDLYPYYSIVENVSPTQLDRTNSIYANKIAYVNGPIVRTRIGYHNDLKNWFKKH